MNWQESINKAKTGKLIKLPGWEGYFKWSWNLACMVFINGDYWKICEDTGRNDYYYII